MGPILPVTTSNPKLSLCVPYRRAAAPRLKSAKALLGCGKHFSDADLLSKVLERACTEHDIATIVHGGHSANGGLIENWCRSHDLNVVRYPPNRMTYGRRAEDIRNQFMLEDSKPDLLIAMPGGESTWKLVCLAASKDIPVLVYDDLLPRKEVAKFQPALGRAIASRAS